MTEDEMVGWHHRLNGHAFWWIPGVNDGQGGLVCCGSWGHKESDTTEQLNRTELISRSDRCKYRIIKLVIQGIIYYAKEFNRGLFYHEKSCFYSFL